MRALEQQTEAQREAAERRARYERWNAKAKASVVHPDYGKVIVPCASPFAAVRCAAEVWGVNWLKIIDAQVWACKGVEWSNGKEKQGREAQRYELCGCFAPEAAG